MTTQCVCVRAAIWNGAQTCHRKLLYQELLHTAQVHGVSGGTVFRHIEGAHGGQAFRSIASEVASNELPLSLAFVDDARRVVRWLPALCGQMGQHGVVVSETVDVFNGVRQAGPDGNGTASQRAGESNETGTLDPWHGDVGLQVEIFTLEHNRLAGKPVYQAVAEFLRDRAVMWFSTTRALSGFGSSGEMHRSQWWTHRDDAPIVMMVLDHAARLEPWLPDLIQLTAGQALVTSRVVRWHHPRSDGTQR